MSKLRSLTHAYSEGKITLKDVRRERRDLFREIINDGNYSLTGDSGLDVRVCETVSRDPFSETQFDVVDITTISTSGVGSSAMLQPSKHGGTPSSDLSFPKKSKSLFPVLFLKRAAILLLIVSVVVIIAAWLLQ